MAIWKKKQTYSTVRSILDGLQNNARVAHATHEATNKLLLETISEAQAAITVLNSATKNVLAAVGEAQLVKSNAEKAYKTTAKELKLDGTDSQK
jgi:hypothetical protein